MNSFERALLEENRIPLHEASSFFISVKQPSQTKLAHKRGMSKTAGWEDPPDETGVLEGQFTVPLEQAVSYMGGVATNLLRIMTAGLIYSRSVRGPLATELRDTINSAEWDHKGAFEYLVERMSVLAGAPHISDVEAPPPSTEPVPVIRRMLRAEQEMIGAYASLLPVLGANPMAEKVSGFMAQCQGHADKYWRLLPQEMAVGVDPPDYAEEQDVDPGMLDPTSMQADAGVSTEPPSYEDPSAIPADVKQAAARMVKWAKETPTDAELKELGRQSAVRTIAAEHGRESARRGERFGRTAGMIAGAAGGGALGYHALGRSPASTVAGAVLGGLAGRSIGGELGTELDIARHSKSAAVKMAASAMLSWVKSAEEDMSAQPQDSSMSSPTDNQSLSPVNYLQAELMGQQLQNSNEANFYKQKLMVAEQTAQQVQQQAQMQVQQVQQETAQAKMDADSAAQRVQAALDEAVKAKDDALKQTETAARMRIGQQDLRMKLLELAAQDPDATAAMNLAQTTGQASLMGAPSGEVMAPDPNAPPVDPNAMGAPQDQQVAQQGMPGQQGPAAPPAQDPSAAMGAKTSSARMLKKEAIIGHAVGGLVGAARGAYSSHKAFREGLDPVKDRVAALEQAGAQDGGFLRARALANAKAELAARELLMKHPRLAVAEKLVGDVRSGAGWGGAVERIGRKAYAAGSKAYNDKQ